jgi:quercetin dioxygenase-like cupin family protein
MGRNIGKEIIMRYAPFLVIICMLASIVMAQDPVKTDSDKYKTVFENARVRVLEYKDKPGAITTRHSHPDSVVYALAPFKRKLTLGDGRMVIVEKKQGEVYWVPAQEHIGENIGTTDTHVLIIELKGLPQNNSQGK